MLCAPSDEACAVCCVPCPAGWPLAPPTLSHQHPAPNDPRPAPSPACSLHPSLRPQQPAPRAPFAPQPELLCVASTQVAPAWRAAPVAAGMLSVRKPGAHCPTLMHPNPDPAHLAQTLHPDPAHLALALHPNPAPCTLTLHEC